MFAVEYRPIPRTPGTRRCSVCSYSHEGGFAPFDDPNYPHGPNNDDAVVLLAQANPEPFLDAWAHASEVFGRASETLRLIDQAYRKADRKHRALLTPARAEARRTLCDSIAAMWLLPHPTQTRNVRVGCVG